MFTPLKTVRAAVLIAAKTTALLPLLAMAGCVVEPAPGPVVAVPPPAYYAPGYYYAYPPYRYYGPAYYGPNVGVGIHIR